MLISLVAPSKLYHTKALPGTVISGVVAALLALPIFCPLRVLRFSFFRFLLSADFNTIGGGKVARLGGK